MSMPRREEAPVIFREPVLYREWGHRLASLGRNSSAIDYFEKAIKLAGTEQLRTLIGYCAVLIRDAKYHTAVKLSEKCMEIDPGHYQARQMRMRALFQAGEFSHSLVHAYEGMRRRRSMTFEHGIYQANETIEDCIGRNTSPIALLLLYPWIRKLHDYRDHLVGKLEKEEDEFQDIAADDDETRFKVNDPEVQQQARMRRLQRVIAKMYLGCLAIDKDFLEEIVGQPEIAAPELLALASACHRNVGYLQDLLRMRRPLYVTLLERRKISRGRALAIERERKLRANSIVVAADFLLRRLHAARVNKDYLAFFGFVDRIKDKFDSYSSKMFPLKEKFLNALYEMVAWVYIDTRDLMCLDDEKMKATYLKHHFGIRVATYPRDCDLAWMPCTNPKERLKLFRRRLAMAYAPLELAWLHHDLCKLLVDICRFDLARFYGKKARDMAQEANCKQWMLNADHLILRIEIHQNNRNEARDAAMSALACAKKLDIDYLIDFYERAIKLVDELDMERIGDFDGAASRQQLILELMPQEMKGEVDFLWRRMDVVPAKRRLSVMPGCKPIDRKRKMTSKRRSILPSPPKDPERDARIALLRQHDARVTRPGFVDFEEFQ
ncbi:tetratricopeptide repeat protein 25-like isoform X2 [Odontomachus brunneus]|uniref:tetratricopeptide repeat protein 25-like isoform X2 n=1 Tax=Odontomachus brunneus TaxID=486640 RepID=UPI0013F1A36E|nr:tetratricopeptide repeat protein 25-like isoform X2 [Odontomachus brunneus]